jgi:DNA-binding IclR family transcriptional regulator
MKQSQSRPNSIEKALQILLSFGIERSVWGVRELSHHLDLSPSTAQRILKSLKKYGFVDQDPKSRLYRLGPVYFRFIGILQSTYPISRSAIPFMERLQSETQETVHLNVVDGFERVCIEHVETRQYLKASMPIGNRSPLYAGASSKCLLAFSPEDFRRQYLSQITLVALTEKTLTDATVLAVEIERTRQRGYASSLGERTPGLGSLSAPVLNHNGHTLAAISLAIPEIRFRDKKHRDACLRRLRLTAGELSRLMGYNR